MLYRLRNKTISIILLFSFVLALSAIFITTKSVIAAHPLCWTCLLGECEPSYVNEGYEICYVEEWQCIFEGENCDW